MSDVASPMLNISRLVDKLYVPSTGTTIGNLTTAINDAKHRVVRMPPYRVVHGCCTWHWTDHLSEAEGWIVIDSPVPTASGGGLFLHERATLDEVRDIARTMSAKLAMSSQPQICGAKGGIRFPSRDPRASHVLERFIRANASVISQYWGTGGDINTDHAVIDKHARTYCVPGTSTALDALRVSLNQTAPASFDLAALLEEPVENSGWPLGEFSVGHVMAVVLKELLSHKKPDLIGRARLVLQGFGCVGSTFAHAAKQLGIGKVVAVSSQYGFYIDGQGIDCDAIEGARRKAVKVILVGVSELWTGKLVEDKSTAWINLPGPPSGKIASERNLFEYTVQIVDR
ncbi:hypothetical protein NM208_g4980 [Fusarium decemcellulare]|uniref:Uncharacterized protein n=1 Tax=Fusarium decemcellulare TaxID=57161 RepID=A0ACC1SIZ6_9HYPO|nr:hypothetical protein NM208_g4980 [Fusarium decemcellulare]